MAFKIGEEGNLPGWDERLTGAKTGDKLDFEYVMPGDFSDTKIAGIKLKIEIGVTAVHSMIVPTLDEEFVKDKLQLEGLPQFENFMQTTLGREVEQQFEQVKRDKALQEVAEKLEAEITDDMVKDELDGIVTEHDRELRRHGLSLEDYLKQMNKTLADFREERTDAARRRIRAFLAVKTIAEAEDLRATREDLMQYAMLLMQREGFNQDQMKQPLSSREFMNETTYQIVRGKVLDHLAGAVQFDVSEGTAEQTNAILSEIEEGQ
jgi:trigger factor